MMLLDSRWESIIVKNILFCEQIIFLCFNPIKDNVPCLNIYRRLLFSELYL